MGEKLVSLVEKETRELDKRSLVSACDIPEGTIITREMVTFKRPGTGIEPKKMNMIIGKRAYRFIHNDTIFQWTDFQKQSA
jgi:sialic acid synthase SpsE